MRSFLTALAFVGIQLFEMHPVRAAGHPTSEYWPQFRGPNASGVAETAHPPVAFGPTNNALWKAPVPLGLSSPIVWSDRVFLTGYVENRLLVLAYDARTGRELWRRTAPTEQIEDCHEFSSPAASTPCTDGERVYAYFGSFGLLAYDFEGREAWRLPLDRLPTQHGTSSSPILAGGHLIVQRDGDSTNAQLIAVAPSTGKTRWFAPRPLARTCYSTPMVWRHDGLEELIVQGQGRLSAYALDGGRPRWWIRGWGFSAITTPVSGDGMLFAGGACGLGDPTGPADSLWNWNRLITDYDADKDGKVALSEIPASLIFHIRQDMPKDVPGIAFPMRDVLGWIDGNGDKLVSRSEWDEDMSYSKDRFNADRFVSIRPGGNEDSTLTHVAWDTTKGLSEVPSPLFYRGRLFFFRDGGMWSVLEPRTGRRILDRERLGPGGQAVASPVAANGFVYTVNEPGTFSVVRAGDVLDLVAVNKLGESVRSTPAISGDVLYVRTDKHLWAFAEGTAKSR